MFKKNFINESGRKISDILEIAKTLTLERFLVTVDTGKACGSVNHCFLLQILLKFEFGIYFFWLD